MTRMSKQGERRNQCPKKPRIGGPKTGSKKDNLKNGFKLHENALSSEGAQKYFIPKIK